HARTRVHIRYEFRRSNARRTGTGDRGRSSARPRGDAPVVLREGGGERLSVAHEAEAELLREVEILFIGARRAGREAILAEGRIAEVRDLLACEVAAELQFMTTALGGELVCELPRLGANP